MLVLTRRIGERILVGDDIVLTVVDIDGNKVRIGIEAPKEMPIYREELLRSNGFQKRAHPPCAPAQRPSQDQSQ